MSYSTHYNLEIIGDNTDNPDVIPELRAAVDWARSCFNDRGKCNGSGSWYEHEKDLRKFSKKYPKDIFKLSGEGEEAGDLWIKYFLNGRMQECRAVITYDPFDPSKLE